MDTFTAVEAAYRFTDPENFRIEDVFHIVNTLPGNQYLEKTGKALRLQSCLLLIDQDLPLPPMKVMELADMAPKKGVFKVSDQGNWQKFFEALKKLQGMQGKTILNKLGSDEEKQVLQDRLSTLSKDFMLPFSEDNIKYLSRKLALDFGSRELMQNEFYIQLAEFREWLDYLVELLKNPQVAEQEDSAENLTLFDALIGQNYPAFKRILLDGNDDLSRKIGQKPLLYYALNPLLVNNNISFFTALAERMDELPDNIGGTSLFELILNFNDDIVKIKRALAVCSEHDLTWNFAQWKKQLASDSMNENLLLLMAESQKDKLFADILNSGKEDDDQDLLDRLIEDLLNSNDDGDEEDDEEYEEDNEDDKDDEDDEDDELEKLINEFDRLDDEDDEDDEETEKINIENESAVFRQFVELLQFGLHQGGTAAKVAASFIDIKLKDWLTDNQQEILLKSLAEKSDSSFSIDIICAFVKSGLLDKQLNDFESDDIIKTIAGSLKHRWNEDDTPELNVWVNRLKANNTPENLTDFLISVYHRTRQIGDKWDCTRQAKSILNSLAEVQYEETFMRFSKELFALPEYLEGDSDTIEDSIDDTPYSYVKKLLDASIISSLQLNDEMIAGFIKDMQFEDFAALVKDDSMADSRCLDAASESGKVEFLEYMLDVLKIPITGKNKGRWSRKADVLSKAAQKGKSQVLKFILNRYPEMLRTRDDSGLLPIHNAVKGHDSNVPFEDIKECVAILCGKKEDGSLDPELLNAISSQGTPLAIAVRKSEIDIARYLLESGAEINIHNSVKAGGPLIKVWLSRDNVSKFIQTLIKKKADVNVSDENGNTIFNQYSFSDNNLDLFEKLLNRANHETVKKANDDGQTVLHCLYENCDEFDTPQKLKKLEKITRKLVQEFGVDINAVNIRDQTVFMTAVENGDIAAWNILLKLGADPEKKASDGKNALFSGVGGYNKLKYLTETLKLPVNAVDENGENLLFHVTKKAKADFFNYLVKKGVDLHKKNNENKNLLWKAAQNSNFDLFEKLVTEYHLDTSIISEDGTIVFELLDKVKRGDLSLERFDKLCRLCIEHGLDINREKISWGDSIHIMQYAVKEIFPETKKILDILWTMPGMRCPDTDRKGNTLLHLLANTNEEMAADTAEYLIKRKGYSVSVSNKDGDWPLHIAASNGNEKLCKVLRDANPKAFEQLNNDGESPLFKLVYNNAENLPLIKKFIEEYDSDINWQNPNDGDTILDTYLTFGNSTCEGLEYFLSKGVRCRRFDWISEKDISLVKLYVEQGFMGNARGLIAQLDADCIISLLDSGKIETLKYLISNGMNLWNYFPDKDILKKLQINEHTETWLRLFFIEWQWPREYLTAKNDGEESFLEYFIDNFSGYSPNVLIVLLEEIGIKEMSASQILEKLSEHISTLKGCFSFDDILSYFLEKCRIDPAELPMAVVYDLLKNYSYPEIFADTIDTIVQMTDNENVVLEISQGKYNPELFKTTLLHAAAGNQRNLFALRYLIEKHNIVLDDRTDDNNLTVWEYAATENNQKAVHYLLDRLGNDPKYVNKTLIAACKGDRQDDDIVKNLCEIHGADPVYKDNFGKTAADYATKNDVVQYLRRKMKEKKQKQK